MLRLLPLAGILTTGVLAVAPAAPAAAKTVSLTGLKTNGAAVALAPGDTLRIALPANYTTPYHWNVKTRPSARVARVVSSSYRQPTGGLPGQGGTQVYVLRAVAAGRTTFATVYESITGDPTPPPKRYAIAIRVRGR
jgi:predicted secreted protein